MKIKSVFDADFAKYGKILKGYNVDALLAKLEEKTEKPADAVIYEPGDADLEAIMGEEFSANVECLFRLATATVIIQSLTVLNGTAVLNLIFLLMTLFFWLQQ